MSSQQHEFTVSAPPQEVYKRCMQINEMPCMYDPRRLPYIEQGKQTNQTTELKLRLNGKSTIFPDGTIHLSFRANPIYETTVKVNYAPGYSNLLLLFFWWMIVAFCILVALNSRSYEAAAIIFFSQYALSCFFHEHIMQQRNESIKSLLMTLFPFNASDYLPESIQRLTIQMIGQNYQPFAFESSKSIASISKFLKEIDRPHVEKLLLEARQFQLDDNNMEFGLYARRYETAQSGEQIPHSTALICGRAFVDNSGVMRINAYTELPYDFFNYGMIALNALLVVYLAQGNLGEAMLLVSLCFLVFLWFWMSSRSYRMARQDQEVLMERLYHLLA